MLKHHFYISLLSTVLLYVTLVFLFFFFLNHTIGTEQKTKEKILSFSLSQYIPEIIPPVEEVVKEEESVEPEPVEEIEPIIEEPIVEEVIPEPIVEKIVPKPKPVVKKVVKKKSIKKKVIKKKRVKKKPRKKKSVKKRVTKRKATRKKPASKKKVSPAKKNAFLSRIRSKINKNKTYPRIAQRRGMQGSVKVRFTIQRSGRVGNISVSGPKVFHSSAKRAVQKSFPISTKNAPISLPETVNLTLHYQLR